MSVRKSESGQAIVLMTLALVVIMGMAAFVIDVGNWYHTKRRLQGTADAAALAGAQRLPNSPSGAQTMAEYGVVLAVIAIGVVVALTALSTGIRGAITGVVGYL